MKESIRSTYAIIIALAALVVAVIALLNSKSARELALSDLSIEEGASLTLPVYDEGENRFSYVALYEVHVSNLSGPTVVLQKVVPVGEDAGFLVALKDQQVQPVDLQPQPYYVIPTLGEIQSNAKLLKELPENRLDEKKALNLAIKPGESKSIRFGVTLLPYDHQNRPLADMALLSFRFEFDNGRKQVFRRGFPIMPVTPMP